MAKGTLHEALDFLGYVDAYELIIRDSEEIEQDRIVVRGGKELYEGALQIARAFIKRKSYHLIVKDMWLDRVVRDLYADDLAGNNNYDAYKIAIMIITGVEVNEWYE